MQNKKTLVLLTFIPIIIGYIINWTIMIPYIGMPMFYVLPLIVLGFWFWLGSKYAKTDWKPIISILIGSATGLISLIIYLWQFIFISGEARNILLAAFSQMYSAAVPTYLFSRIATMFETQSNQAGIITMVTIQVMAVLLMMIVFTIGYFKGKKYN